jgi:plastocyanin
VLVANGGLENVFVYVKDGLGTYYFETPTETIKLDQKGCRYTPHVFGLRAGQPVEISNSDPTMHTVHAIATSNQEFNLSQPIQGIKNTKTFTAAEVMVHFKCNVHTWMDAYAGVLSHPYFAVTASGGAFELKGLPPGTYTVEAWHEKLGTRTQSVTVGTKESKTVDFRFVAQ